MAKQPVSLQEINQVREVVKTLLSLSKLSVAERTVDRYARVLAGINEQQESLASLTRGIFKSKYEGMVVKKDIPIYSYCAHHLLPWFGKANMAYIAHDKILGTSKFARLARYCSVGLTVQEDVTTLITDFLVKEVSVDCMVTIEAIHTCEVARGVENPFSSFITLDARGLFREKEGPRLEFLSVVNSGK